MAEFIKAVAEKSLVAGEMTPVEVLNQKIVLTKLGTEYFAFADICTHHQCSLSEGFLEEDTVVCPCHGAKFSVRSGEVLALPATEPIKTYPVKVEDGWVMVEV